ncbi:hypothetical protein BT93_A0990 [Corymbia citriodora subsp. variegata]|nr:hypothetical protein BT93_A0990 [Corymbia citriodora subsp. variegata]
MDGMRRSFDRSRELVPKKPRLTEELGARPFGLRPGVPVVNPTTQQQQPRFKLADREVEGNDPSSEAYQPQPLPQHQQHQELVEQYRTALAELTFNSKPIITNLTIIAGENLHAAKAIAGTVCTNILEVPSDQKLPSLYLLDSIVKNIGRDYIKYFAAKLPEVFCKAYRQVDATVHSAMRHLFGTWKGVFHPQTLQYIERQLGFGSTGNGSLASTTSRSDSQSQRPAHSIHVNPKYLERQRLQQSSGAKVNDVAGALASSSEDLERLDGAPSVSGGHTWEDPPVKTQSIQRLHRDSLGEAVQDKRMGVVYGNYDYGSDTSRSSALGAGRITGKISEQGLSKPWYGTGGSVAQSPSSQRNGFSGKHGFSSYQPSKSATVDSHLQPSHGITSRSGGISSSWKNSEEEEFMWDSVDPGSMERDVANIPSISRKDHWTLDGAEEMGSISNLGKPLSKDGFIHTGTSNNLGVSEGYPGRVGGLSSSMSSFSRREVGSEMRSLNVKQIGPGFSPSAASSGSTGSQRIQSLGPASPSGQSLAYQPLSTSETRLTHQKLQNLPEQNYPRAQMLPRTEFKTAHLAEKSSVGPNSLHNQDSLSTFRLKELKPSPPSTFPLQTRHHRPQLQQARSEPAMPEILGQNRKPLLSQVAASSAPETSGLSSKSSALAADIEVGAISRDAAAGPPSLSLVDPRSRPSRVRTKPPSLTGPPPVDSVSDDLGASLSTLLASRHDDSSVSREASQVKVGLPSVPPGPPPTTVDNAADRSSSAVETTLNPVSSLLSTLVAKGLISTSKPESTSAPSQMPMQVQNEAKDNATTAEFGPDSSASVSTALPVSSTEDEVPIVKQVTKSSAPLPHSPREIKNLIGFEFKPSVVREFSESVIIELFEDFPHRCGICGVQLKFQEHLNRHLAWHDSKDPESKGVLFLSRGWYLNLTDWVARKEYLPSGSENIGSEEKSGETTEMHGPMVPADESQCACILCGELFDEVYSLERDEWMFKGAVHMDIPPAIGTMIGMKNQSSPQGPIVHASCISESSLQDLGLANDVKLEKDA